MSETTIDNLTSCASRLAEAAARAFASGDDAAGAELIIAAHQHAQLARQFTRMNEALARSPSAIEQRGE